MKRILVPIDGSKHSKMAMQKAKELSEAFGSSVVLLHVNDFYKQISFYNAYKNTEIEQGFNKQFDDISIGILEEGKEFFSDMADRVEIILLKGNVADNIIEYADKNDFDVIVMGSHGTSGIQSFLIGSVTRKVALNVNKSVMIVR